MKTFAMQPTARRFRLSTVIGVLALMFFSGASNAESKALHVDMAVVDGFDLREAVIVLSGKRYRIDRTLLRVNKSRLGNRANVVYSLDMGQRQFPGGIVTELEVLKGNETRCPPVCM